MCQRVVISNLDGEFLRKLAVKLQEQVLVLPVAGTNCGYDERQERKIVGDLGNQVKSFLRRKARDNPDYRQLYVSFLQPELAQQVVFALFLTVKAFRRILADYQLVFGRIPLAVVHAVQDPADGPRARGQYAFHAKPVFGCLNFLAVLADECSNVVGKNQGAFEEVYFTPEFHLVDGKQVPGQHQQGQDVRLEQPLVSHVVNRE